MKIGIISFAHMHAYSYAQALSRLPGVELAGIADDNRGRGQKYASEFGTAYYAHYSELLAQDLDGVVVTSENVRHKEHVLAAAALDEIAVGEAEAGNGAAEAVLAGLHQVEARLDHQAFDGGADLRAAHLQGAGRQHRASQRPAAGNLHGADHGAVAGDLTGAARPVEAIERKELSDNEMARLGRGHLTRCRRADNDRGCHGQGNERNTETPYHSDSPTINHRPQR